MIVQNARGNINMKTSGELYEQLLEAYGKPRWWSDDLPSFIIDTYTRRFLERLGYFFQNDAEIRSFFENSLPKDYGIYGWFHWLILDHGIQHCRKTPVCEGCTFYGSCQSYC